MIFVDKLCWRSKLRYENAGEKFAFSVLTLCICVASRSMAVAGVVLAVMGILTTRVGGVSVKRYLKYLGVPLGFLLLSTLSILFHLSRAPLDLFAIPLGSWYLTASRGGFSYGGQLILTALASVSCLYFLSFTTPVPDILEVLKKLRCPKLLMELMLLIYRFVFVLMETASAISVSQRCRLGSRDMKTAIRSFGQLGAVLMLRASGRSEKLYSAMEARCYDDTIRFLPEHNPPRPGVIAAIGIFDTALAALAVWGGGFA